MGGPGRPAPRQPLAAVASTWCGDPDYASAYSYLRPGATPADRDLLAVPIAPGLHLAGEATWSAHPGTMHGAWWSGERAANRVLDEARAQSFGGPVVVLGAGLAGLAAARLLADAGCEAIVLEAGPRPGGRAQADTSLGVPVHLGASWAHGHLGNPVAELAARVGVRTEATRARRRPTVVVGRGVLTGGDLARLEAARAELDAAIEAKAQATAQEHTADRALGPVLRELVRRSGGDDDDQLVLWTWLRAEYEGLYAAPVDDLSLRHRAEPYMLPGDDLTLLGSLDRLVTELARGLDVRLAQRARAVRASAAPSSAGPRWVVVTERGDRLAARSVIVTVPIGALAAGRVHFEPPLPAAVRGALGRIGPGRVAKVVATFAASFWAPHHGFSVVDRPPVPLPVWIDISELAGVPALAAFATADAVAPVEAASAGELATLVGDVLRHVDLGEGTR